MALQEINIDPRHLVQHAMDGDTAAFADLVAAERMSVLRTARALLRDHHEAEDAAQEAFVAAWRNLAQLRDPEKFRPWLMQILTRIAFRRLRLPRPSLFRDGLDDLPARPDGRDHRLEQLLREVRALPDHYRVPLSLFYLAGLSHREVAEAMGTTTQAVKSRLHRARAKLRKKVDHE